MEVMFMEYDVWKTLFTRDLDNKKYLYHYTNIENAIKILTANCLKFQPANNYNNYVGAKVGIAYVNSQTRAKLKETQKQIRVDTYLHKDWNMFQILCFCTDVSISNNQIKKSLLVHSSQDKDQYFDITGRGFALPYMWSKFSNRNNGVCFIINKKIFEENLRLKKYIFFDRKVQYFNFFKYHEINNEQLIALCRQLSHFDNKKWTLENLIENDEHYLKYNFFEKLDSWKHEHEYRYVVFADSIQENIAVDNFNDYLEGVVIDEMPLELEKQLKDLLIPKCKIKRINFGDYYCKFR